jgi:DNA modification methylase
MLERNTIIVSDCLEGIRALPDRCIQCVVTSPPYFGLRDYGVAGQLGLESTPEEYIKKMVNVFREVKRVLADDGTIWINIGDSYWGGKGKSGTGDYNYQHNRFKKGNTLSKGYAQASGGYGNVRPQDHKHQLLKAKDLIGIPWMLAFALREDGWWLREDIIWYKKNCMPESVSDRCTRCHEYIFMLSKQASYYYDADAIKTNLQLSSIERMKGGRDRAHKYSSGVWGQRPQSLHKSMQKKQESYGPRHKGFNARWNRAIANNTAPGKANRRSVWHISTRSFKEKHYATFPLQIPEMCIKAGSIEKDVILDPFMGAGTTALAAGLLSRDFIGFELNPEFVKISEKRLRQKLGLFYQK